MNLMQQVRARMMGSITFPANRFFTPLPVFWQVILELTIEKRTAGIDLTFMDCGCGTGALISEALDHGIKLVGCDLMPREGQSSQVLQLDATRLRWTPNHWPLICRPDHDGWAAEVISNAAEQGARAIYVGLPRNYSRDVAGLGMRVLQRKVGRDGETMYITGM